MTHTYDDDGWYTVRLTVMDEDSTSSFVETMVKVLNRAPIAKASASSTEVSTLVDVSFTGEASKDDDGKVLWYHWDFGDGTMGYGMTVVHAYADDGTYTVTLTVTDDDGGEGSITTQVTVLNRAPVSVAGEDRQTRTGIPVRLDGRGSYDMDGTIALYHWEFGDGTHADGPVVTHAFPTYGTFVVELTVTDDDGATDTANLTVIVDNVQPVARITGSDRVLSGELVELDATSSYDLDGNIVEFRWDMGDGSPQKAGPIVEHSYSVVDVYTVTLTVEDDGGLTSTYQMDMHVLNRRPIAVIDSSRMVLPTGETVQLGGTGSSDPDGTVKVYTWIFGDGSVAYGSRVNHVYEDDGIFMVVLTVTDDLGGTDSTSVFIQVE
nr:PKD domain-containing protein [Thermoplasmata archaeon]NIS11694.1 PKD domain-containing protein [Thermoplasmata archaeon]NIS19592.1 PKD domain-containing protein [Thermoplasmata archaeon]NIT76751.1 PKD domain-containing protein [Thermoplasmata archaeon]NIU48705.1 PKD domain-containing protein [Thermoplasmata archaeon]